MNMPWKHRKQTLETPQDLLARERTLCYNTSENALLPMMPVLPHCGSGIV